MGITRLCDQPRPPTNSHNFAATIHDYTWQGISSPPPPTPSHNFTPSTHDHTQTAIISIHYFTHNHLRPTIIKSPLPTNDDSLATTLFLAITNFELYFCHHYSSSTHPAEFQEQSKFIRHYPPNTKKFSFSESMNSFHSQFAYYYASED